MAAEIKMLLDRTRESLLPEGYIAIETEREFLQQALSGVPALVRGEALCRWAKVFWKARGVPVEEIEPPRDSLRSAAPDRTPEQAGAQAHGTAFQPPLPPSTILETLQPEALALSRLCPPSDPGLPPETVEDMRDWFERRYLRYRWWEVEHGSQAAHQRVAELASCFARWCLNVYPAALHGGVGHKALAISQARRLRETRKDCITLWVILDGLPYSDLPSLTTLIQNEPRLTLIKCLPVLTLIPTVSEFCKPALMNGRPHRAVEDPDPKPTFEGARPLPRQRDPQDALRAARRGDVFVWSLLEPDETYHKRLDRSTIRTEVAGQIRTLAHKIVQAALAVPTALPLRLVISTDHGRLLTSGLRQKEAPSGMQAHGRAAWGTCDRRYGSADYLLDAEQGLVFLNKERFELPVDCAVVWGGEVFATGQSKGGAEEFAHGGLYPEEVLVPWVEFARDRATLAFTPCGV